jgi:hypothetical protein
MLEMPAPADQASHRLHSLREVAGLMTMSGPVAPGVSGDLQRRVDEWSARRVAMTYERYRIVTRTYDRRHDVDITAEVAAEQALAAAALARQYGCGQSSVASA